MAEDPDHLTINLWFNNENFPIANSVSNASIYFEKISGKRIASWSSYMVQDLGKNSRIGYDDFSDPGNIIQDDISGKKYIVDTELKSFKLPIPHNLLLLLFYAGERFRYLNNIGLSYTYTIDLTN